MFLISLFRFQYCVRRSLPIPMGQSRSSLSNCCNVCLWICYSSSSPRPRFLGFDLFLYRANKAQISTFAWVHLESCLTLEHLNRSGPRRRSAHQHCGASRTPSSKSPRLPTYHPSYFVYERLPRYPYYHLILQP